VQEEHPEPRGQSALAALGDAYWTPDLIERLWKQAANGKVPVSGAGYRGPFCGPGFDMIWTDMSEIVRPTRDGIHGREYISTVIELGRKPNGSTSTRAASCSPNRQPSSNCRCLLFLTRPGRDARRQRPPGHRPRRRKLGTLALASLEEASGALAGQSDNCGSRSTRPRTT